MATATRGKLEFEQALHDSVVLLAGLDASVVAKVQAQVRLMPGSRTLIRTLRRLGFVVGVFSDGFTQITDDLVTRLGLNFAAANTLEIVDGELTGRLVGEVLTGPGKAAALRRFAAEADVPLSQTVAVGTGVSDLDLLRTAGLSVGFNPHSVVREVVDTTITGPFLDPLLYFLGISRKEIEEADTNDS